ncbi:hypothetical protein GYMLUDRAFT_248157 [Collybiopsis luxurians FD-317 M1]|uniref:Uncharacterized protein n=1 Tax=Collybiopsis luxurians FD-317 M1 TaxID=944289 RepID=A0A0D0C1G7_9AGAR|nr:hypothetical protein GYMLUDRAFT_248157 [Collybiopsis luxurians FD-317 M1]
MPSVPETDTTDHTLDEFKASRIVQEAKRREEQSAIDTLEDGFKTALELARDAGEMLRNVPYVKAVAAMALQIFKIYDEIKEN